MADVETKQAITQAMVEVAKSTVVAIIEEIRR